jgi:hypothetical protein
VQHASGICCDAAFFSSIRPSVVFLPHPLIVTTFRARRQSNFLGFGGEVVKIVTFYESLLFFLRFFSKNRCDVPNQ